MRTVILHRWYVTRLDGKRVPTRHLMTLEDALATDPTATLVPGTLEVRAVPDGHFTSGAAHLARAPSREEKPRHAAGAEALPIEHAPRSGRKARDWRPGADSAVPAGGPPDGFAGTVPR